MTISDVGFLYFIPSSYLFDLLAIQSSPTENQWYELSGVYTALLDIVDLRVRLRHEYADNATANGKILQCEYAFAINLTSIYGAGNEPTEADCAKIFSYFDGTKSIQLPARVRSVGKNLFDIVAYAQRSTPKNIVMVDSTTLKTISYGGAVNEYGKIRLERNEGLR